MEIISLNERQCKKCSSFMTPPINRCELCNNSFCLECLMYYFIIEQKCPLGCDIYLPKKNTKLENELPEQLHCPRCNQFIKIDDFNEHKYKCPQISIENKISILDKRIKNLTTMVSKLKRKKFILPTSKRVESSDKFGDHPHQLCFITSKHNKICNNCVTQIENTKNIYYCSLCDFVVCVECFSNKHITESINNLRNGKEKFSKEAKNFINQQDLTSSTCKLQ